MSKMGLHDPFRHFKYKLWPKERLGSKLSNLTSLMVFAGYSIDGY
jgi:hypothetical protein